MFKKLKILGITILQKKINKNKLLKLNFPKALPRRLPPGLFVLFGCETIRIIWFAVVGHLSWVA